MKCKEFLTCGLAALTLGMVPAAVAQMEGEYQVQPIFSRYAETVKKVTFNANVSLFNDMELQEADHFDGWTVDADLTIPIPWTKTFQLRLEWPFYTDGTARVNDPEAIDNNQKIDVRGYGGVWKFPNAQLEWQFLKETNSGFNMAAYAGIGEAQRVLWTTEQVEDVYNHAGVVALFGLKADWRMGEQWRFVANVGGGYYLKSDDINPEGPDGSDRFFLSDISVAAIWRPWEIPVYPVAELLYQTTFFDYNAVQVAPEVIWAVCSNFELKAAAPIGLTDDGGSYGGKFQATVRF